MTPPSVVFDKPSFMKRMLNDRELCIEVIEAFLADLPCQLERLEKTLAKGDLSALAQTAHTIKGASSNMSALALQHSASKLEEAARDGESDKVRVCLKELIGAAQEAQSALETLAQSINAT